MESDRLLDPDNGLSILYSSRHGVYNGVTPARRNALQVVERTFGVAVLYGKRRFGASSHEVILVDGIDANQDEFNRFKYYVWEHYGLDCGRYEVSAEFNRYFAIAQPIFAVIKALGADRNLTPSQKLIVAHEWMGMPVVFAAQLTEPGNGARSSTHMRWRRHDGSWKNGAATTLASIMR